MIKKWVKRLFDLYELNDLTVGAHCGCCGQWIPNKITLKSWRWDLCKKCTGGEI